MHRGTARVDSWSCLPSGNAGGWHRDAGGRHRHSSRRHRYAGRWHCNASWRHRNAGGRHCDTSRRHQLRLRCCFLVLLQLLADDILRQDALCLDLRRVQCHGHWPRRVRAADHRHGHGTLLGTSGVPPGSKSRIPPGIPPGKSLFGRAPLGTSLFGIPPGWWGCTPTGFGRRRVHSQRPSRESRQCGKHHLTGRTGLPRNGSAQGALEASPRRQLCRTAAETHQ